MEKQGKGEYAKARRKAKEKKDTDKVGMKRK
jgi:hypothetical protein